MVTREEEILLKTHGEQGPAVEVLSSANSHSAKNLEAADLREKSQNSYKYREESGNLSARSQMTYVPDFNFLGSL